MVNLIVKTLAMKRIVKAPVGKSVCFIIILNMLFFNFIFFNKFKIRKINGKLFQSHSIITLGPSM